MGFCAFPSRSGASKPDPLDLRLRDPLFLSIIKPGCAGARMRSHVLRVFERAAVFKEVGEAGRSTG